MYNVELARGPLRGVLSEEDQNYTYCLARPGKATEALLKRGYTEYLTESGWVSYTNYPPELPEYMRRINDT